MKILVAEDDPVSRRLLQNYLERWGHDVVLAEDGGQAWQRFEADPVPLVITDWMMPELDGTELIRRIRALDRPEYVYTILLTAKTQKDDVVQGMDAGADDFVTKPFDRDELRVRVRAGERILRLEHSLAEQNRELDARVRERTTQLEATQEELLQAERDKKRFTCQVISAVTRGKLQLVEPSEMVVDGSQVMELSLDEPAAYSALRKEVQQAAQGAGMAPEDCDDLVLAVGEAATNAIKHGAQSACAVFLSGECIQARVSDHGPGIRPEALPDSVLRPGFSTKVSLGMGYTLMMELVDRVWLATGPEGTVVQLDKALHPVKEEDADILAMLERFS
jgi:DNA-binding response OmpR family regulator/anti-sigma regulatory factor (Ser/Thr protein kinase)